MVVAGQTPKQVEQTLVARFGREKMGYARNTEVFVAVTLVVASIAILTQVEEITLLIALQGVLLPRRATPYNDPTPPDPP